MSMYKYSTFILAPIVIVTAIAITTPIHPYIHTPLHTHKVAHTHTVIIYSYFLFFYLFLFVMTYMLISLLLSFLILILFLCYLRILSCYYFILRYSCVNANTYTCPCTNIQMHTPIVIVIFIAITTPIHL